MVRRSMLGLLLLASASIAVPPAAMAATVITNGSFEAGAYADPRFDELTAGSTVIAGWTIDSGSVDAIGWYWVASDGARSIDLNGQGPGAISQTLATTVGATYVVAFDLSGNPAFGGVKTLTVSATGAVPQPESFDIGATGATFSDMHWSTREYMFVATVAETTLTFASTSSGPTGPALDNVRITETLPPPPPPVAVATDKADCSDQGWTAVTDEDGHAFKNQGDCVSFVATDGRNTAATAPTGKPAATPTADSTRPVAHGRDKPARGSNAVDTAKANGQAEVRHRPTK